MLNARKYMLQKQTNKQASKQTNNNKQTNNKKKIVDKEER